MKSLLIAVLIILLILITYKIKCKKQEDIIRLLMRQVYRWYIAAVQDEYAPIKLLHANYAVGYISALKDISSENEIYMATGLDINKVSLAASHQQDIAMQESLTKCPNLMPEDEVYKEYIQRVGQL